MNQFQKVWAAAEKKISGENQQQGSGDGEDATMKTADRISSTFTGHHLTKAEKKKAGPLVYYAFGTFTGAVYGAAVEVNPSSHALVGMPFGAILFAGADELALPLLGLSDKPTK